jgi:hypothetical protein
MPTIAPTKALTTTSSENCGEVLPEAETDGAHASSARALDAPAARAPVDDALLHAVGLEALLAEQLDRLEAITQYGPRQ